MISTEKKYLRELAKKQRELAYLPEMENLRKQYWDINCKNNGAHPTVRIETQGFRHEFIPGSERICTDHFAKRIEDQLLYAIYHNKIVNDDQLVSKTYQMGWRINVDNFGFPVTRTLATKSNESKQRGYRIDHAITDIEKDFHKLKPLKASVDRDYTEQYRDAAENSIGDILPIEMTGWPALATNLTKNLLDLMSMENFYLAVIDTPDQVHRLMKYLLQNAVNLMNFFESERIM
jgi:hypothetical protein